MNRYEDKLAAKASREDMLNPCLPSLDKILIRIGEVKEIVRSLHGLADRVCGSTGEGQTARPVPVPNGLLDQIETELDDLRDNAGQLTVRFSRLCGEV